MMTEVQRRESIQTWREIRQRGAVTCHGHRIPPKCEAGICDSYPEVDLCAICNPCPCEKNIKLC